MYILESTNIPDVKILSPKVFADDRGYFYETYSQKALEQCRISFKVKQENHIMNVSSGVIRGLHFQNFPYAQAKIVRCIKGEVDDVAVDLRKNSPTYLQWVMVTLSEENKKQLYIPKGFAHGVISRSDYSEVQYVVDEVYSPEYDRNIKWNDPQISVQWGVTTPILSEKDLKAPLLCDSDCNF